ncbi:glycosyltransferase family 4 protein [Azospirillum sp. RWY-5-1]|uniref:Glycosyltransferase family 4 protein n=1 Tax=Azospirillum oleiclasticum TaxID=2735135 RepID=A0ABX2TJ58_9PROT|nr:glycosyltransferase family 4 protein [Azospirillum oleiclasticum]NYZ24174.1 glycosyltransferase family 4 protein [Azospirillum oleiclasticum]
MRIAICDFKTTPTNPIGRCHIQMMQALCDEHEFVVFAPEFENPRPDRIRWVRVPTPLRPLALQFVVFFVLAPLALWWDRLRTGRRFDAVISVESNIPRADVVHAHFCHRAFIRGDRDWSGPRLQSWARRIDHHLRSLTEPFTYGTCRSVVACSDGLRRELEETFPWLAGRVTVIANPLFLDRLARPAGHDSTADRARHGFGPGDLVLVFAALGHFERKGLPLVMQAMARLKRPELKLLVVGGRDDTVADFRERAARLGLEGRIAFAGMQADIRPFLWLADGFVFPSQYEAFSLVSYEAAAAGLPIVVSRLHGVDEFARDGDTALVVERTAVSLTAALERFVTMGAAERRDMGARAAAAVSGFTPDRFVQRWRGFLAAENAHTGMSATSTGEATP